MHALVKDVMTAEVILGLNIAEQVRHVEGVVAVRDRFTYPGAPPAEPEFQSPTAESP